MKRIGITSLIAAFAAIPAFAEGEISDANGLLTGKMCVVGTLNTSTNDSTANLEAIWTAQSFTCPAGQYLEADNVTCTTCPAGSYCNGFTNVTFADADIGAYLCSTVGDGTYTSSAAGSPNNAYCYSVVTTTCAVQNPYVFGHGTAVYTTPGSVNCKRYNSDTMLYDTNGCTLDTVANCAYTLNCDTGYHSTGTNGALANYVYQNASWDGMHIKFRALNGDSGFNSYRPDGGDSNWTYNNTTGMSNGEWSVEWWDGTRVYGTSACETTGGHAAYITAHLEEVMGGQMTPADFFAGLAQNGATSAQIATIQDIFTKFSQGTITEAEAMRRVYRDTLGVNANYTTSDTGQYCWCKMDGYSIAGGASVSSAGAWVFNLVDGDASDCAFGCADHCADAVHRNSDYRAAVFGSLGANMECTANTINLNWYTDTVANGGTLMTVNAEAQQCTYDGAITLPTTNPTKTGYTFSGWRLRTTSQNNGN